MVFSEMGSSEHISEWRSASCHGVDKDISFSWLYDMRKYLNIAVIVGVHFWEF